MKLSRRNLLTLLAQLENGENPIIVKPGGGVVTVESDAVHYAVRDPGPMSAKTEHTVREFEGLLTLRSFLQRKAEFQKTYTPVEQP